MWLIFYLPTWSWEPNLRPFFKNCAGPYNVCLKDNFSFGFLLLLFPPSTWPCFLYLFLCSLGMRQCINKSRKQKLNTLPHPGSKLASDIFTHVACLQDKRAKLIITFLAATNQAVTFMCICDKKVWLKTRGTFLSIFCPPTLKYSCGWCTVM